MPWTRAVGWGLSARVARRARLIADREHWRRSTMPTQAATLRSLLRRAATTTFGRANDFARLASLADDAALIQAYRAALPVRDWYGFKDEIARMREAAEPDVLWPGLVTRFAQTSGTTAGDKFIPVSDQMLRSNFLASMDIFASLRARGVSLGDITDGRCLFLGGSSDLRPNAHGIVTADLSGLVTPMIRWPISAIYSPGPEIALLSDWPEKIEKMADLTRHQDIRMISGMPSWTVVLMKRILELTGARCIREVWPNLRVFVHGGVRYGPFKPRIGELFTGSPDGDIPVRHELYPASEAFIAMQDHPDHPAMRLLTDLGNYYEFVPLESLNNDGTVPPEAPAFTPATVEPGVRYIVVLTTCAGLWRYNIGDVVEFDEVCADLGARGGTGPARLRIVGRHRHFINAFGENLIVEHIERAVEAARDATGIPVGEFTAAPVYPAPGRQAGLELVIELESHDERRIAAFADRFDASLKAQNVDYTTKRGDDLGMGPPTITPVPPGAFHAWMQARGKLGGQHKCPRCANHREFVDAVTAIAGPVHA